MPQSPGRQPGPNKASFQDQGIQGSYGERPRRLKPEGMGFGPRMVSTSATALPKGDCNKASH